jgi:hypothetical protein
MGPVRAPEVRPITWSRPGRAATAGCPLTEGPAVQEVKGRRHTHAWWLGEIVGAMHDVGTKASMPTVVGDHTDQAEWTRMVDIVEEIAAD